jgi:hypothetical protein
MKRSWFLPRNSIIFVIVCASSAICAQIQDAPPTNTDESWTATTQYSISNNTNPSRMTERHTKSGNRIFDRQSIEILGPDGRYQPYLDSVTETVKEDATTIHSIVRTYNPGSDGEKVLVQVTDEKTQSSANGEINVVRTTSNPDLNGGLWLVQREVADTRKTGPDSLETKTTVYFPDGSGNLAPVLQSDELQKRGADDSVEVKKTNMLPDGNGGWQVCEVRESTIKQDGKNRISESRVSLADLDGRLSQNSRTIVKTTEAKGPETKTVETYSLDVPGIARDGNLHMSQRVTSVHKENSGVGTTEQQVEQPDPGNPSDGLKVTTKMIDIVTSGTSGPQETNIIKMRNPDGIFSAVSVAVRKSDQPSAIQIQIAPPDKRK